MDFKGTTSWRRVNVGGAFPVIKGEDEDRVVENVGANRDGLGWVGEGYFVEGGEVVD